MALILSIETATQGCSVALHRAGELVMQTELNIPQMAGSQLGVLIDQLLKDSSVNPNQLQAIAISSGPGSYTGLRIGVATAKGLCFALGIPLISMNTLELMAYQAKKKLKGDTTVVTERESFFLCPMLDARRMEVYAMLTDHQLKVVKPTEAIVIDEQSFEEDLNKSKILFFGDGSDKCRNVITHSNAYFIEGIIPSAEMMGDMVCRKWNAGKFEELLTFEPFYLKDFMIRKPKEV